MHLHLLRPFAASFCPWPAAAFPLLAGPGPSRQGWDVGGGCSTAGRGVGQRIAVACHLDACLGGAALACRARP